MRLHASVFGFLTETPVISLNYHAKCKEWCDQTGMPESHIFDASDFDPGVLLNVARQGLEDGFKKNGLRINSAIQASMKNWRFNDELTAEHSVFGCYTAL